MASLSANLSFPTLLHYFGEYMSRMLLSLFGMLGQDDNNRSAIEEAANVGDVEEAFPSLSPADDMQQNISDVVKFKWKYITYAFSLLVISF